MKWRKGLLCRLCIYLFMCYIMLLSVGKTILCWIVGWLKKYIETIVPNVASKGTFFLITSQCSLVAKTYFIIFFLITESSQKYFSSLSHYHGASETFCHLSSRQPGLKRSFSHLLSSTMCSPPVALHPTPWFHPFMASPPIHFHLPHLYMNAQRHWPWRWQLNCLLKHWETLTIYAAHSQKDKIVCHTPAAEI